MVFIKFYLISGDIRTSVKTQDSVWFLLTFQAADEFNGLEIDGRKIVCCRAQKKQERAMDLKSKFEAQKMERINRYQGWLSLIFI